MSKAELKPTRGLFAGARGSHIWHDTTRFNARDVRQDVAKMYLGYRTEKGTIDTLEWAWRYAKSTGVRVVKVDIVPHEPRP